MDGRMTERQEGGGGGDRAEGDKEHFSSAGSRPELWNGLCHAFKQLLMS